MNDYISVASKNKKIDAALAFSYEVCYYKRSVKKIKKLTKRLEGRRGSCGLIKR